MFRELHRMAVFVTVIQHGSFSRAAAALGLGKSVVSQHVALLEKGLGVKLINRSTRSLALTEAGREFYNRCRQMMDVAEGAMAEIDAQKLSPAGTIRMTASYNVGVSFLIARLSEFREKYPDIDIDLWLDDAIVNLIEEGFDLALRVGPLADTRLHAVTLARCRMVLCASPAYLARHKAPEHPADLMHHPWVSITQLPHPERVILVNRSGQRQALRLRSAVKTNTGIAARSFILESVGIGLLPDYAVTSELAAGGLVELLPDWREATDRPISAIFPTREHMPLKVRLLVDLLKRDFGERASLAPHLPRTAP
jgi:LysR family transcriptional regulator, transcriptional activator for aaeXAB operon